MSLDPGDSELIGWGRSCIGSVGGPQEVPNTTVAFYCVKITAKGEAKLIFDVTPTHVRFDEKGEKRTMPVRVARISKARPTS